MDPVSRNIVRVPGFVKFRAAEAGDSRLVAGKAVVYNSRQLIYPWYYEEIDRGCFGASLSDEAVRCLWQHDSSYPLGSVRNKTLRLDDREDGLYFEVDIAETRMGDDALALIRREDVHQCSFCCSIQGEENGKEDGKYWAKITEATLYEISFVTWPAYSGTHAGIARNGAPPEDLSRMGDIARRLSPQGEEARKQAILRNLQGGLSEATRNIDVRLDGYEIRPL